MINPFEDFKGPAAIIRLGFTITAHKSILHTQDGKCFFMPFDAQMKGHLAAELVEISSAEFKLLH